MKRVAIAALSLSASALVGIALHEGYRGNSYDDGVGVQTIGFGTTDGVKRGDTITVERALVRLLNDANSYSEGIKQCIDVPLYQHEFDAYSSFAYNAGVSAFCRSTMAKKLNAGDYTGACNELKRWVYAGGRKLPGLVKRREQERRLCLGY
jgi:lysozyme